MGLPVSQEDTDFQQRAAAVSQFRPGKDKEYKRRLNRVDELVKFSLPSVIAGFANTVSDTLGITDDGEFEELMNDKFPNFGDFYSRNRKTAAAFGDLAGMFIPGTAALKAYRAAGITVRAFTANNRRAQLLNTVFTSGKKVDQLVRGTQTADLYFARKGIQDISSNPVRRAFARRAMSTKVMDSLKESAAFEVGVLATMNESDLLYPEEFSMADHIVFGALGPGVVGTVEALAMRRLLRQSAQSVGIQRVAEKANNPQGVPFKDMIDRTGTRDVNITVTANHTRWIDDELATTTSEARRTQLNRLKQQNIASNQDRFRKLGTDKMSPELTKSQATTQGQINSYQAALDLDPNSMMGAVSVEAMPGTFKELNTFTEKQIKANKLQEKRAKKLNVELQKLAADDPARDDIAKQITDLRAQQDFDNSLSQFVVEPSGEIVQAHTRKPIFTDLSTNTVHTLGRTQADSIAIYEAKLASSPDGTPQTLIGFNELGLTVLPNAKTNMIGGINATRIIDFTEAQLPENFKHLLRDIGADWHFHRGARGKEISESLPIGIQKQVRSWITSPNLSQLRRWFTEGAPESQELYNAYAPLRERLAELADENGTIPLLRGESAAETKKATNDLVSMTSDPGVAKGFKGFADQRNLIVRRVPVEDVVAVIGGKGNEFEFLVRGNLRRAAGATTNNRFRSLSLYQRSSLYTAASKAVDNFKSQGDEIIVGLDSHHTQLDYVLELAEKHGDEVLSNGRITLDTTIRNIEDLEFASLKSKYTEYVQLRKLLEESVTDKTLIPKNLQVTHEDIRKMLNLPSIGHGEQHPAVIAFESIYAQGDNFLDEAIDTFDHFKRIMQEETLGMNERYLDASLTYRGNMMKVNRANTPFVTIKRPIQDESFKDKAMFDKILMQKATVNEYLGTADEAGADLVKILYDEMQNGSLRDAVAVARQVDTLVEGTQKAKGTFTQQSFAVGDGEIPAARAVHDVEIATTQLAERFIGDQFDKYVNTFSNLRSRNNHAHLLSFNTAAHAIRQGWELDQVTKLANEVWGYNLKQGSLKNEKLWKARFGDSVPMPKDALLPRPTSAKTYSPLGITSEALEAVEAITALGQAALRNTNHIRRTLGQSAIRERNVWVPPKNLSRQELIFIIDGAGQTREIVSGRTVREAQAKAAQVITNNPGEKLFTAERRDLSLYFKNQDEAFDRFLDFTDPLNQTGTGTGKTAGTLIETGTEVLDDMVGSINKQFQSIPRRTRALMFESEVNYARSRYHLAPGTASRAAATGTSIWQQYTAAIYGNQTLNPNQITGKLYQAAEGAYDEIMNRLHDKVMGALKPAGFKRVPSRGEVRHFENLDKQLGAFNPFTTAVEFANKTHQLSLPPRMKKHMAALNNVTSALTLRIAETGHAVLNMTSLFATYAPVIRGMKPTQLEIGAGDIGRQQWLSRISAYGSPIDTTQGLAVFNPHRAVASAMHDMFDPEFRKILQKAASQGKFRQDVAEMVRTITAPQRGYVSNIIHRHGKVLTFLSDKSEELSRTLSWAVGYRLARDGMGMAEDTAMTMAQRMADSMIGNYRANNRPRVFQGAAGMPLGLFMTFMQNYYQRMFGYIENKQTAALVSQYASQASIFGAQSVPGFDQFSNFFASNYDGSVNPVDAFRERFGDTVADWVLYGSLSNLPKMFGADDGIALFTRGDMNMQRVPVLPTSMTDLPSLNMLAKGYGAIRSTAQMMRESGGFSSQQMLEIIGNYSINRKLSGLAYIAAGEVTDKRGAVINNDVRSGMSIAARVLDMRPQSEAQSLEASARNRQREKSQRARMRSLREFARAEIRGSKGKLSSESLERIIAQYTKYHGGPEGLRTFSRWLTEQYMSALVDKDARELLKAMRDPTKSLDAQRLLAAGANLEDFDFDD